MVMGELEGAVSSGMVARRLTQSTPDDLSTDDPVSSWGREGEVAHLQSLPVATSASLAVDSLRTWSRWMGRSEAINLAPDPTILVKGLTSIVQGVLAENCQASFRTSLVRSSLKVDVAPSYKSVLPLVGGNGSTRYGNGCVYGALANDSAKSCTKGSRTEDSSGDQRLVLGMWWKRSCGERVPHQAGPQEPESKDFTYEADCPGQCCYIIYYHHGEDGACG